MVQCVLCKDYFDSENPFEAYYAPNPITFRNAWMHSFCFNNAYEEIAENPASKPEYLNRQDEYEQRFA